ncbi:MAG: AAA family ATPase [Thaumarchaeota archaeon]|nr:AAA family ATPase [Nitrososphaerota archaeon]
MEIPAATEINGADAARRLSSLQSYPSGSAALDRLLGGGYKAGRVAEFFGKSNSGKTQLAMQAVLCAARAGVNSLFIDTEGSFRPERLEEVARVRGWKVEGLLERILFLRVDSFSEQMELVSRMGRREATRACRVVVLDTLTRNFSLELPGSSNLASRQGAINVHLSQMARDAYLNGRAYVLTNRVTFGPSKEVSIGGSTVEQLVGACVRLERDGDRVRATHLGTGESAIASLGPGGVD